jgi:hypothetical protein
MGAFDSVNGGLLRRFPVNIIQFQIRTTITIRTMKTTNEGEGVRSAFLLFSVVVVVVFLVFCPPTPKTSAG